MTDHRPNEKGLRAARAYAGWYLGASSWADDIVRAYLNPDSTLESLKAEQEAR